MQISHTASNQLGLQWIFPL